jgi:hypothetical protein
MQSQKNSTHALRNSNPQVSLSITCQLTRTGVTQNPRLEPVRQLDAVRVVALPFVFLGKNFSSHCACRSAVFFRDCRDMKDDERLAALSHRPYVTLAVRCSALMIPPSVWVFDQVVFLGENSGRAGGGNVKNSLGGSLVERVVFHVSDYAKEQFNSVIAVTL